MHTMSEAYTLHTVKFTVCLQYSLQYSLQYARLRVQLQNGMHYVREVVRLGTRCRLTARGSDRNREHGDIP